MAAGIETNPAGNAPDTAALCNFYGPFDNTGRKKFSDLLFF
jgi:hypothetical protein